MKGLKEAKFTSPSTGRLVYVSVSLIEDDGSLTVASYNEGNAYPNVPSHSELEEAIPYMKELLLEPLEGSMKVDDEIS